MALARGKTTHFTFDGESNTETDVRETATKIACDGFVWGSHTAGSGQATAPSSTYRHWQKRHVVTDPQNNLSHPKSMKVRRKQRGGWWSTEITPVLSTAKQKSQDNSRDIWNFTRDFTIWCRYSNISQWTLNDVPPNPGWEALREVQSVQYCRGAVFKVMMGEETGRSVHVDSPENVAIARHEAQHNEWFTNHISEHKATANYVRDYKTPFVRKSYWHNQTRTVAHETRQILPHRVWKFTASSVCCASFDILQLSLFSPCRTWCSSALHCVCMPVRISGTPVGQ